MTPFDIVSATVKDRPHSFDFIRRNTSLRLSDRQFEALISEQPARFKLVRFVKRDPQGKAIRPGRGGVRLLATPVS